MLLGIDIGGTNIKSAMVTEEESLIKFIGYRKEATRAKERHGEGLLKRILELVGEYNKEYAVTGVAISTAGVVDGNTFEILYANENIPNYKGINFAQEIQNQFNLPCIVENDVNAATLGEWKYGSGESAASILCLTVGTGIGGGLILNNELYRGYSYSAAEVGYMTLESSTFENLASTQQLVNIVRSRKKDFKMDGEEIFKLAKKGDADSQQAINQLVRHLCLGISNCVYVVNPEMIILGGGIMEQQTYLMPLIQKEIDKIFKNRIDKPQVVPASLGNSACLAGVYWLFNSV